MAISRTWPKGKAAFETSASVTAASTSRARGPISDSVPQSSVTSVERRVEAGGICSADPGEVMGAEAGAGDDVEVILGEPGRRSGRTRCRRAC